MSEEEFSTREELELWNGLLNHVMWKQLEDWAKIQTTNATAQLLRGCDQLRDEDQLRGLIEGVNLFISYPKLMVEQMQVSLDNLSKGEPNAE